MSNNEKEDQHESLPPAGTGEAWLTPGRFALGLAVLVVAAFPDVLLGGRAFNLRDFGLFSYPVAQFNRECFWRGELPLWNPFNFCGLPFLAQWNTLSLYPFSLIYLLLPLGWSLSVFCLAHLFWGGLGMYFLARAWTRNELGASLAGIIFAFNGLTLNFLMWPSHVATFAWLPWVLWLGQAAWREGGRKLLWATLAGAMQVLAGGPETLLFTWGLLLVLASMEVLQRQVPWRRVLCRLGGVAALVALVCSAQLLPFMELAAHSQRGSGYYAADWSMPLWGLANLLVPLFRAFPNPQGVYLQPDQYWTTSYYAGIASVFLALVAVRRLRDWRVRLLAALAALGLVLAFGDRGLLYQGLRLCLPGLASFRYPVKFVILVLAVVPLLAGFGLAALARKVRSLERFERLGAVVVLALTCLLAGLGEALSASGNPRGLALQNGLVRAGLFVLAMLVLGAFLDAQGGRRRLLGCSLLIVAWLDLVTHVPRQNPSVRPMVYSPQYAAAHRQWRPPPKLGESRAMLAPAAHAALYTCLLPKLEENYLASRLALLADCNLLEDLPQAYGFFSLVPQAAFQANLYPYSHTNQDFPALLDFMGVSQITAPGELFAWVRRPTAMPLVTSGQEPCFLDDASAFAALTQTNTDLRQVVFLPPEARGFISATQQVSARILATDFGRQKVRLQTEAAGASLVVVSQTWYPAWKARVDGAPARLWRANYAFQAVEVPAGRHTLELAYEDTAFLAGAALSGLGLLACASLWLRTRRTTLPQCPDQ